MIGLFLIVNIVLLIAIYWLIFTKKIAIKYKGVAFCILGFIDIFGHVTYLAILFPQGPWAWIVLGVLMYLEGIKRENIAAITAENKTHETTNLNR
jgi:hypothetical protein